MKHQLNDIWIDKKGEIQIKTPEGTKSYYRYLVEQYIGFPLPKGYTVHHIDCNHSNNELQNLMIVPTPIHVWIHRTNGTKLLFESNLDRIKEHPEIIEDTIEV